MSSSTNISRKETERTKLIQEKCQTLLTQMLRDEDNKYCVDCDAKGPRWASWNLGVFLCIRCAGIHRNLGVHISRVKSVNLDSWTPEQVISLQQMGNSRARAVYEAQLPDGFRRPQTDTALESFIRAKYEHKKYLAREWVPPSPPKVDWAKEIDEELEKQKRKKKAAQANSVLGIGVMTAGEKKLIASNAAKSAPLPAPLPKPRSGQSGGSPKTQRSALSSTGAISVAATAGSNNQTDDLLGLSSPIKPVQNTVSGNSDLQNDSFSGFLSATPAIQNNIATESTTQSSVNKHMQQNSSLAKEEEDFFNGAGLLGLSCVDETGRKTDRETGKLTKDSILALYATAPTNPVAGNNPHNQQMNFGHSQPVFPTTTGVFAGYMNPAGTAQPMPQQQQQQFMTPPNSASMYNAPVMTAPTAFSSPSIGSVPGAIHGMQYPFQNALHTSTAGYPGGGMPLMPSTVTAAPAGNVMPTMPVNTMGNNVSIMAPMASVQQQPGSGVFASGILPGNMPIMHGGISNVSFPTQGASTSTANLNQQFGNLNIGNVWQ